jgi:flagellar protein FliS
MSLDTKRRAYQVHQVETATPVAQLLLLLDQLETSLDRVGVGFRAADLYQVHCGLMNAQAIVALLRDSLRTDLWEGAHDLHALYQFSLDRLIKANLAKDPAPFQEAASVLSSLVEAWREAARRV